MLLRNSTGGKVRIADYDSAFVDAMNRLYEFQPGLFSVGTCLENFSLRRSMRRGSVMATGARRLGDWPLLSPVTQTENSMYHVRMRH